MNDKSVQVVHIVDSLNPGGAERVAVELVNALSSRNIPVSVCVTRSGNSLQSEIDPQVEIIYLNRAETWEIKPILDFVAYCRRRNVRIIHAHGRSSLKFGVLVKALLLGGVKLIFHDHFGEIEINDQIDFILKWSARCFVDRYVGVSPALLKWAETKVGLNRSRLSILGNAIDITRFQTSNATIKFQDCGKPFKAAVVANLRSQKGHDLLLHALAASSSAQQQLHIYLAGMDLHDEYSDYIHNLVREFHLEDNITFLGAQPNIPELLKSVDFGLLSSQSETGPLVLLEYLASGLPVLATRTGEIACKLADEGLPFFVTPGDVAGYASALEELISLTDEKKQALKKQGYQFLNLHFDLRPRVTELIEIYRAVDINLSIGDH